MSMKQFNNTFVMCLYSTPLSKQIKSQRGNMESVILR